MAEITNALFTPFKFPNSTYAAGVTYSGVIPPAALFFSVGGSAWYIVLAAYSSSPAGTLTDPINIIAYTQSVLGGNFLIRLNTDGKIQIDNFTGETATITFVTPDYPNMLGFGGTVITVPAVGTVTADYQPTHCLFAFSRENDTGWQSLGQMYAAVNQADGSTYGWKNGIARWKRSMVFKYHPKNKDGMTTPVENMTPCFPDITDNPTQWKSPTDSPVLIPPWTVHNFFNSQINQGFGKPIMACFGNFQENVSGTDLSLEQVYLSSESVKAEHFETTIKNYDKFRTVNGLTFNLFEYRTRQP
jgi:hypothetical protein